MSPRTSETTAPIGNNRTGAGAAPERAEEMVQGMDEFPPSSHGDGHEVAQVRVDYSGGGVPTGSIPEKGADGAKTDPKLAPFLDKLGARLAFERAGTRLYDALLSKHEAFGVWSGGPAREDLEELRREEHDHFLLLQRCIGELGGDATSVTPSANLQLTAGRGIPDIAVDPRTNLLESLEAVLIAELADHENWDALVDLAEAHGLDRMAAEFREALATEDEHLHKVRDWVAAGQGRPSPNGRGQAGSGNAP